MASSPTRMYGVIAVLSGITICLLFFASSSRVDIFSFLKSDSRKQSRFAPVISNTSTEVQNLREQIALLSWELIKAQKQVESLTEFREKFSIDNIPLCIPAYILVKRDSSPHRYSFIIDRGYRDGIVAASPVVYGHALIGRVWQVGANVSRIVYVTDPRMRISVILVSTSSEEKIQYGEGVCIGKGSFCQLQLVEKNYQKWSQAHIVTSGFDGDYPPGLLIGTVEYTGKSDRATSDEKKNSPEDIGMFWNFRVIPKSIDELQSVLVLNGVNFASELKENPKDAAK